MIVRKNKKGIAGILLFYWLVLIIWQAVTGYTSGSIADSVLKAALLFILAGFFLYYYCYNKGILHNVILFFIYCVCMALSFVMETSLSFSTMVFYGYNILIIFLIFVVGATFEITAKQYMWFINFLIVCSLMSILYIVIFERAQIINAIFASGAYGNELTAFFVSSHEYSLYLSASIIGCAFALQLKPQGVKKFFYIMSLIILIPFLFMTFSRTSIYSTVIFFVCFLLFSKQKKIKFALFISIIILFMLFIFIQPLNLLLNNLLNKGGSSRLDLYNYAIEYYSDFDFIRLLFGNGIEGTRSDFEAALEYGSVHCAYLQVLLYFGFCGLLWLVLFLLFSLVRYIKLRKNSHQWSCNFICILLWSACIMLTNTTIIFTSPIDSFFLTTFAVILPLYVSNAIKNGYFFSNSGK